MQNYYFIKICFHCYLMTIGHLRFWFSSKLVYILQANDHVIGNHLAFDVVVKYMFIHSFSLHGRDRFDVIFPDGQLVLSRKCVVFLMSTTLTGSSTGRCYRTAFVQSSHVVPRNDNDRTFTIFWQK